MRIASEIRCCAVQRQSEMLMTITCCHVIKLLARKTSKVLQIVFQFHQFKMDEGIPSINTVSIIVFMVIWIRICIASRISYMYDHPVGSKHYHGNPYYDPSVSFGGLSFSRHDSFHHYPWHHDPFHYHDSFYHDDRHHGGHNHDDHHDLFHRHDNH